MTHSPRLASGRILVVLLIMSAVAACSEDMSLGDAEGTATVDATTTTPVETTTTTTAIEPTTTIPVESTREAVLLASYVAASNAGDVAQAMRYFAPDPVVRRHPFGAGDYIDRSSELRALEEKVAEIRGSGAGMELVDIAVPEGSGVTIPDITFGWRFFYGADGTEADGEAGCVGGKDGKAFISNGMITEISWGFNDPNKCSS